ncbi:MAG: phytanoyl-CoA dioxygenase family protein [Holophagales bacterium]|nr:phytanoyl-CoA dioxygenase family protein [Holophagales bacterium]MYH23652.1 phytanoyl-CoA dioxygenase family protein [Holophagales bacterium]
MGLSSDAVATPTRAQHAAGMAAYQEAGRRLAAEIGNRGPIRLTDDGRLHPDILAAYWRHGFYVFEGLIDGDEVAELRRDANEMLERAPVAPDAAVDAQGRPALGLDYARRPYLFTKPLADPWGGTELLSGRHPTQMTQPLPEQDAPADVVFIMSSMCQAMPSGLRLYGHPHLLEIAAAINGNDFVPFNDAIFVKQPGLGGSVSWHQDGVTHWGSPDWDEGIHGFNFQVQLYPTTPASCLWVVPGSHKLGKIDIKARVRENGGSEKLPGALPLVCDAGDVTIVNRQMLHASFANTSSDLRISLTFGFHRRKSVEGQKGALGVEADEVVYDAQRIFDRSSVIAVAIDARRQHRPDEASFVYQPFAGLEDDFRFNDETFDRVIRDYNLNDLAI